MAVAVDLDIRLIGHTAFTAPEDIDWDPQAPDGSALAEFAGRACYETFDKPNPHTATNAAYIRHILDVGHLAVLEHASATMYLRGVSRSCSHEIMRHRMFSFSQLSQRYVPAEEARVVLPAAIAADEQLKALFLRAADVSHDVYGEILQGLAGHTEAQPHAALRLKQARQAARAVLPNATETRFVMTGNFRSWRHFIAMRAAEHADAEIRAVAVECLRLLQEISPEVFADFSISQLRDGTQMATSPYVSDS
ncbi:FAD-dependent thymidylate synthase [Corynebacterium heidelbergense]|uniref:Flavin-dependent thymidylate synthase n=1 Tax=Corynebacterium heidelbergense TaxID=2055947 RepID=A0A364VBX7_9CORY|nr:FAD-dependent thymidylate synthase [Corynebacterium heidelbergense]RAV34121.1 thymidylate synthase (FAD) [Corynebacterium heidelbergense]WCZ36709.1 Thymidylate synthase ThyX [Corynebacterium heidelbergense]